MDEDIIPISYLIKYKVLDNLFSNILDQKAKMVLYFDVKNIISGLHRDEDIINIIEQFKNGQDKTKIAKTIIFLANHYARYFKQRNIEYNLVFFDDRGVSAYHNSLNKDYKANRKRSKVKLSDIFLDDKSLLENFANIYDKNISILNSMFKHMDNISFVNLTNLESDFIPYFMIKEEYMDENNKIPSNRYNHIIFGNDKDFLQLLTFNNIFQICRKGKNFDYEIISKNIAMKKFIKDESKIKLLTNPRFIPLLLAIGGDTIDNVQGIPTFGYITAYKFLNELYEQNIITDYDTTMESFLLKLKEYMKISKKYAESIQAKKIISYEDRLLSNFKLVSFKELYDYLSYKDKKTIKEKYSKVIENRASSENLKYNLSRICAYDGSYKNLL